MSRFAARQRVFYVEEPVPHDGPATLQVSQRDANLYVVVPHLPGHLSAAAAAGVQEQLLERLLASRRIHTFVAWYYTPMALTFTSRMRSAQAVIYDCMDDLSGFRGAAPELVQREAELFGRADLVFTGGRSLFEAKRQQHAAVHLFPSSVDVHHFAAARLPQAEPADQTAIAHPRLGYCGVLDERLNFELLASVADARPDWQMVLVGPLAKIDPSELPRRPNIHYLGPKAYAELPAYLSGWEVALLPFAHNDATRFISPTKTPEYLAAGCGVVSTSVRDVVRPYGERGLARIADTPRQFVASVAAALAEDPSVRRRRADAFLEGMSWDATWDAMRSLLDPVLIGRRETREPQAAVAAGVGVGVA
jgi:UDP-galactopyranose mutase